VGALRLRAANLLEANGITVRSTVNKFNFLWVVDFPLFEESEDGMYN